MPQIAYFSLVLALLCAVYTIIASVVGLKTQSRRWIRSAANALRAIAGLLTLAVFLLLYFLLQRDFQIKYVASYTDITLSPLYAISALWAGQEGSLLFWNWMLSLCSAFFIWKYKKNSMTGMHDMPSTLVMRGAFQPELPYTYIVLSLTIGFFLILLMFTANPFQELSFIPINGNGMNPLLQNPYMAIHPPVLFIGYAGFVVPFALSFAALCTGKIDDKWVRDVRWWTLFSWYFLGMGILLGARWAYLELGWGGYWGWDPVENGSLMPWITSTALIHTLILQRRRGLLKLWNIFLGVLTFSLCVFGTFITRSGILASVHAFTQSTVGYYFLAFLITTFICTSGLILYRWKELRSHSKLHSVFSKESSFFLANQLFMGLGFAVLYGTVYPLLSEIITGKKVIIGPSFFNTVSIPLGLVLLGLIGVCQRIVWKKSSSTILRTQFLFSLGVTLVGSILFFVLGIRHLTILLTCSLGLFVFITICVDIGKTFWSAKHRWAGYIFHLGTVVVFIGIAVSATYHLEQEIELQPGESSNLGGIRFQYERLGTHEDDQKGIMFAEVTVFKNEKKIATVKPEKRFYGDPPDTQVTTEIGLYSSLKEDIYVILAGWKEDQTAIFTFIINPLITWIWIGGFGIFTVGIFVVILPTSRVK